MKLRQTGHRYIDIIKTYYKGCNAADVELMMSKFADEVVHYFVDHGKVVGAQALATYWSKVGPRTHAHWTLDHCIVQEPEAVIEWTMQWTPRQTGTPELLRGAEWYLFDDQDRILEIRSYHNNFHLQHPANRELHDYPYGERGYRC